MPNNIKTHPIADNQLRINNKEYIGLGINKVITGIETQDILQNGEKRTEIILNDQGLNERRIAIEEKEIYKLSSQKHHNWFILDLETGKRGWFPGSKIKGNISQANIMRLPSETSEVIETITNSTVDVLEITRINQEPVNEGWYKVKFNNEGYVKKELVSGLRYE